MTVSKWQLPSTPRLIPSKLPSIRFRCLSKTQRRWGAFSSALYHGVISDPDISTAMHPRGDAPLSLPTIYRLAKRHSFSSRQLIPHGFTTTTPLYAVSERATVVSVRPEPPCPSTVRVRWLGIAAPIDRIRRRFNEGFYEGSFGPARRPDFTRITVREAWQWHHCVIVRTQGGDILSGLPEREHVERYGGPRKTNRHSFRRCKGARSSAHFLPCEISLFYDSWKHPFLFEKSKEGAGAASCSTRTS